MRFDIHPRFRGEDYAAGPIAVGLLTLAIEQLDAVRVAESHLWTWCGESEYGYISRDSRGDADLLERYRQERLRRPAEFGLAVA